MAARLSLRWNSADTYITTACRRMKVAAMFRDKQYVDDWRNKILRSRVMVSRRGP